MGKGRVRDARHHRGRRAGDHEPGGHKPRHPHPARQLLLRRLGDRGDLRNPRSTGQPGGQAAPVEPDHPPEAPEEEPRGRQLQLGHEPPLVRSAHRGPLALDTGGGAIARLWATALAGIVDIGYVKATGHSVEINLPKTAATPEMQFEWSVPERSNTIERNRARVYFIAYAAAMAFYFLDR